MVQFVDYALLTCTPAGRNKNSTCFKPEKAELFTFCKYGHILKGAPSESINIKFTLIGLLFSKSIWMYSVPAKAYLQIIYMIRFYFYINKTNRLMVPTWFISRLSKVPGVQFNRHFELGAQNWALQVQTCLKTANMTWARFGAIFWADKKCLLNCTLVP